MKNISIWNDIKRKTFPELNKDLEVDVLIIGGGITGISSLFHLKDSSLKVCLVEKNRLASGVTSRTTAKLTILQEDIYSKLTKYFNKDVARKYFNSQKDAIDLVKNIIDKNRINCDFEKNDSYLFDDIKINTINKEKEILKELVDNLEDTNILANNKIVNRAIKDSNSYVFHPLKYLFGLVDIINRTNHDIYENTKIKSIKKEKNIYVCKTSKNIIKTKKIIFALHYPYFLIPFFMPLKCYIEKSYIGAYKVNENYMFNAINLSKPTISFRYYKDYEIFLTNSHNTCIKDDIKNNFKTILDKNPVYIWSNKDILTYDKLPFIGSLNDDNSLLIGTGYNTWGMTNGSLAGKILSDIILGNDNKYISLFNPKRCINYGKIINTPIILGSNGLSFIKSKLKKNNNIRYEIKNGKEIAIYKDENGIEHKVYNLCPHLKCGLNFNAIEKTWDCPCHGSRFSLDGKCIEGPSNYDIKFND